jgi:hypothetical protein
MQEGKEASIEKRSVSKFLKTLRYGTQVQHLNYALSKAKYTKRETETVRQNEPLSYHMQRSG